MTQVPDAEATVPLRLNLATIAGESPATAADALGTLAFAPRFLRSLERALRAETWEDRLPPSRWDESPYVVRRLRVALGDAAVDAALALRAAEDALDGDAAYQALDDWREYRPYAERKRREAAERHGLRLRDAERAERRIGWMVRHGLILARHSPGIADDNSIEARRRAG